MAIDLDTALAAPAACREIRWDTRDVLLYHLSLGAGHGADAELGLTLEKDLTVFPTFAMVAGQGISSGPRTMERVEFPGIDIDLYKVLHAGQGLVVHAPLPATGSATVSTKVVDVWDKGKAAVIVAQSEATGADGTLLWTATNQIWARGEGGFGGQPGPEAGPAAPDRAPDLVVETPTWPGQALLYRLNGDMNPLHADPDFAAMAGFDRPIIHGLASYGIVAKAVVDAALDGDPTRLTGWSVRFSGSLFPGETYRTSIWRQDDDTLAVVTTCADRDDAPVLTHAIATVRPS